MRLLPEGDLIRTSEVDHADWNYRGLLAHLQRKRFELVLDLLGAGPVGRLLEIGYGSGVLMPELSRRSSRLAGVDPHPHAREVREVLRRHGVAAELVSCGVTRMPFEADSFDCAIAVSAFEYVDDVDAASNELRRVLVPGGALILVTPGHSWWLDFALRLTTGEDADSNYADRRQNLIPGLTKHFRQEVERVFPAWGGRVLPVYRALRLINDRPAAPTVSPAP